MSGQADISGQSPSSPQAAGPDPDPEAGDETEPAGDGGPATAALEGYEPL